MSRTRIIVYVVIFFFLLAALSAVSNWYGKILPSSQIEYIKLPPSKAATKIKEVAIPAPPIIITLDKTEAVKKLDLPDWVKNDVNKQVTRDGEVAPYEGVTSVEAIFDLKSGKTELIAKQKPLPFFDFKNDMDIYAEGGLNTKGNIEIGGGIQWDFFRVASTNIGLVGGMRGSQDDLIGFAGFRFTYHKRR